MMQAIPATVPSLALQCRRSSGFTMIEIMIVMAIIGIILATGIPAVFQARQKDALRQAVNDLVEGCSHARAQAILQGGTTDFVIRAEDGEVLVQKIGASSGEGEVSSFEEPRRKITRPFRAKLDEDVAFELLYVNFEDQMALPECHVRFFPNGTSDEFTAVVSSMAGSFKVSLDVITGLASFDRIK